MSDPSSSRVPPGAGAVPEALVRGALDAADGPVPELVPAATLVVLRDGAAGPEVLMVRRNASLAFAGGMWVFPGGRLDPGDRRGTSDDADGLLEAARRAAARETLEETSLVVPVERLVWMSHWTPPARPGRRFATWFFVTALDADHADALEGEATIAVDGSEITDHRWLRPLDAHRLRDEGEIELSPPTWITLWQLASHPSAASAVESFAAGAPEHFATRVAVLDDEVHALYAGDAGYEASDATIPGPRHRLRMRGSTWVYERDV